MVIERTYCIRNYYYIPMNRLNSDDFVCTQFWVYVRLKAFCQLLSVSVDMSVFLFRISKSIFVCSFNSRWYEMRQ